MQPFRSLLFELISSRPRAEKKFDADMLKTSEKNHKEMMKQVEQSKKSLETQLRTANAEKLVLQGDTARIRMNKIILSSSECTVALSITRTSKSSQKLSRSAPHAESSIRSAYHRFRGGCQTTKVPACFC